MMSRARGLTGRAYDNWLEAGLRCLWALDDPAAAGPIDR
jgi:hypothetical protein